MSIYTTFGATEAARITGVSRDRLADWLSRGIFKPERPQRELRPELTITDLFRLFCGLHLRALGLRPEDAFQIPYSLIGDPMIRAEQDIALVRLLEPPIGSLVWREVVPEKSGPGIGFSWGELSDLLHREPMIVLPLQLLAKALLRRTDDYLSKTLVQGVI
jgi:hypothetical protein